MGNILNLFKRNQEFRILMQGLDAAGKTTILYRLKLGEVVTTIPTIGFNVETVEKNNLHLTVWDVGGRDKMRALHRHYYPNTNALVFVIDGTDRERLADAKYELDSVLKEDDLRDAVLLVLVNKQDLRQAMSSIEVSEVLQLHKVKHKCNIFPITAITGEGLDEAFDWLSEELTLKDSSTNQSVDNRVNKWSGYWLKSWKAVKNVFAS